MSIGKRLKKLVTGKKTQRTARKDTNTPKRTLMFATHVMGGFETSAKSATASNRKGLMQARNQTGQQLAKHVVLFGRQENSEFFHDFVRTVP
jgi:succinate dehydrogenase/fumarate reductase flavoprotein subunit